MYDVSDYTDELRWIIAQMLLNVQDCTGCEITRGMDARQIQMINSCYRDRLAEEYGDTDEKVDDFNEALAELVAGDRDPEFLTACAEGA